MENSKIVCFINHWTCNRRKMILKKIKIIIKNNYYFRIWPVVIKYKYTFYYSSTTFFDSPMMITYWSIKLYLINNCVCLILSKDLYSLLWRSELVSKKERKKNSIQLLKEKNHKTTKTCITLWTKCVCKFYLTISYMKI